MVVVVVPISKIHCSDTIVGRRHRPFPLPVRYPFRPRSIAHEDGQFLRTDHRSGRVRAVVGGPRSLPRVVVACTRTIAINGRTDCVRLCTRYDNNYTHTHTRTDT